MTTEHDGLRKDGEVDQRTAKGGNTEFAHGKVDPHEAGAQGGKASGGSGGGDSSSGGGSGEFAGGKVDPVEAGRKGGQTSS